MYKLGVLKTAYLSQSRVLINQAVPKKMIGMATVVFAVRQESIETTATRIQMANVTRRSAIRKQVSMRCSLCSTSIKLGRKSSMRILKWITSQADSPLSMFANSLHCALAAMGHDANSTMSKMAMAAKKEILRKLMQTQRQETGPTLAITSGTL